MEYGCNRVIATCMLMGWDRYFLSLIDDMVSLIQSQIPRVDNYEHKRLKSTYSSCLSSSTAVDCNAGPYLPIDGDVMTLWSYSA
jgi:hypothetical protein